MPRSSRSRSPSPARRAASPAARRAASPARRAASPARRAASPARRAASPVRRAASRSRSCSGPPVSTRRAATRSASRSGSPAPRRGSRSGSRDFGRRRGRKDTSRSPMSNRKRHVGNRDQPEASSVLGVFGLSLYTTERDLEKEFGRHGPLVKVKVVLDGKSGQSRGFAFLTFESSDDATAARNALTDTVMDGRKIRVDYSITKRAHTPTPGMYMGRDDRKPMRRSPDGRRGGGRGGRSPSPYGRGGGRGRSPSPRGGRGRSPSPRRYDRSRRSPGSPRRDRRRSPSPYGRRGRSRSPLYRRRSPSPRRGGGDYRR